MPGMGIGSMLGDLPTLHGSGRLAWAGHLDPLRAWESVGCRMTLNEFFAGRERSRELFDALSRAVEALGPTELRVTKSQIAFRRRQAFAWAWIPGTYLRGEHAPLVLTISFRRRDASPRWKEIVAPAPGRFTHHLELYSTADLDDEVRAWLHQAWETAG